MKKIGVLSLQGDVSEHVSAMKKAALRLGLGARVLGVNTREGFGDLDALVIPGGESTTIGKLISMYGMDKEIRRLAGEGKPIMGTCAGMVLLAKEAKDNEYVLKLMDMSVERNAFGRQRESFEADIHVEGFESRYHAVFIRAPAVKEVFGGCRILSELGGRGVLAQQDNLLALSFHPELTNDTRMQEYFLRFIH